MDLFLEDFCRSVLVNYEFLMEWTPLQPDTVYPGGRNRFRVLSSAWDNLCFVAICRGSDDLEVRNQLAQGVEKL